MIAAFCEGTIVLQARERSGSLYTLRASLSMGKPVLIASPCGGDALFAGGLDFIEQRCRGIYLREVTFWEVLREVAGSIAVEDLYSCEMGGKQAPVATSHEQSDSSSCSAGMLASRGRKKRRAAVSRGKSADKHGELGVSLSEFGKRIVGYLSTKPADMDTLLFMHEGDLSQGRLSVELSELMAELLQLELDGVIERGMDGRYRLVGYVPKLPL